MSRRDAPGWARALLRLYPRDVREAHGAEMLGVVTADLVRARAKGPVLRMVVSVRCGVDLFGGAIRLRLRPVDGALGAELVRDLQQSARSLFAQPLVLAVVALTLGLGVGLNTALFSVVNAVLLRPLEFASPDRLVLITANVDMGEVTRTYFGGGDLPDLRSVEAFADVEGAAFIQQNLSGAGHPRQVGVGWTSGGLFGLLGVDAVLGRTYRPDDPMGTVVLDHGFWQEHFGGDASVLGSTVRLDGHPHTVVGVLPPDFRLELPRLGRGDVDLWKNPDDFWQNGPMWTAQGPDYGWIVEVVGRLRAGATLEDADAGLAAVGTDWRSRWPAWEERDLALDAELLRREVVGDVRTPLLLLMAAVGAVLLIACANVMGILLVRMVRRRQEVALRVALGASRGRIVRWLLGESFVFSLLGGAAGLMLGVAGIEAFNRWAPALPRGGNVGLDARVFGFALLLSLACTVLVGLLPALGASRVGGAAALAGRRTSTGGGGSLRSALVVAQIALSLVLMVGAGLLGSTLARLAAVDPGFESEGLVTFDVSLPGVRYDWPEGTNRFLIELEDAIAVLPGVESAGVGWPMPLSGSRWSSTYRVPGSALDAQNPMADYRVVTPGYFGTLGVRFVEGRTFEISDPRHAVIVGRRVAEAAWPEGGWLGREVVANPWGGADTAFVVVGVVEEVRSTHLRDEPNGALYFDARGWSWADWEFDVLVRTERATSDIVPQLREVVAALDPEVPLANEATMDDLVAAQLESSRAALGLMGLFSGVAGLLAFLGLYGVIAYSVRMRTRELGIRIALGSARSGAVRLILAQGLRLTLGGVALGLVGAFLLSGLLRSWLFGVEPTDPMTYVLAAVGLGLLSMVAAWLPARQAARLEPMEVLRTE